MKYFVIATKWDPDKETQIKFIAGAFGRYADAALFRDAYNERYSADAKVVEDFALLNA